MKQIDKDIKIVQITTKEDCTQCNLLLEKLINFESAFDELIIKGSKISNFYENTLGKDNTVIFCAKDKEQIVGYVMAYGSKSHTHSMPQVNVMSIFVDEAYRHSHIGSKLLNSVENWATKVFGECVLELTCYNENKNALDFYKRKGFSPLLVKMRKHCSTKSKAKSNKE